MSSSFLSQQEIEKLIDRLHPDLADEVKQEKEGSQPKQEEPPAAPAEEVERVEFPEFVQAPQGAKERGVNFFESVPVTLDLELGAATLTVREILALQKDSIIRLDKLAGENAALCVNGKPLASGEVVVINDNFGFRVAEVGGSSANPPKKE
ncbi:FliM/FliN family flagellar motor switch protein [Dethiobacter alkaliphilus]|uniref:Surface presentation of antigens (SPOA) protein n=1 Tax=Dethiobacter alkaliphilus AHT 1 TaxID=555088 RepID=C0GJH0_DETAL|nr:FliM/FliN family flagellar motor switch protein [Dethiobacter alkaliphilus]EEG76517.1 surface presentation of antigens (SPOA) protein [Dethiobacter alkaliphilus AHT 1]